MHCYESTILVKNASPQLYKLILQHLEFFAKKEGIKYYGILNLIDKSLISVAHELRLKVNYMWDRFYIDFLMIPSFEDFLEQLNREGRQIFKRQ